VTAGGAPAVVETEQAILQAAGPLPLAHLAERVRRPPREVGVVVTSLAERGLVQAGPSAAGRRGRMVSITRAGRQASYRSGDREIATIERALAEWPRAEAQRLADLLTGLARSLAAHRDG
jgi:DNA-binding MarR family transcriptional regulator